MCDPFCGIGTTAVACVRQQKRFVGVEIEERFCEEAVRRIREAESQLPFEFESPPVKMRTGNIFKES